MEENRKHFHFFIIEVVCCKNTANAHEPINLTQGPIQPNSKLNIHSINWPYFECSTTFVLNKESAYHIRSKRKQLTLLPKIAKDEIRQEKRNRTITTFPNTLKEALELNRSWRYYSLQKCTRYNVSLLKY